MTEVTRNEGGQLRDTRDTRDTRDKRTWRQALSSAANVSKACLFDAFWYHPRQFELFMKAPLTEISKSRHLVTTAAAD